MDKFTSLHFAFMIWGVSIVSLKTYPTIFLKKAGKDSWVLVVIASILILLYYLYIVGICKKNKCFNMYKIYIKAIGKFAGTAFFILFILTLMLTMVESASVEGNSMHTNMLLETPQWFFMLFLAIPAIYTAKKGKVAIVTITLIGITLIMMAGINLAILTAKYKHFKYLFPLLKDGFHGGQLYALIEIMGLYGSALIVFPFLEEIKDKSKLMRDTFIGLIVLIQMQIVSATGIVMTFDGIRPNMISYPKLIQTQLVDLYGFLESGELYVMLQIVGGWYLKYSITFYILVKVLKELNIKNKYIHYIISVIVIPPAFYYTSNLARLFYGLNIYAYVSFVNFIIIPLIIFIIFSSKCKKNKRKETSPKPSPNQYS